MYYSRLILILTLLVPLLLTGCSSLGFNKDDATSKVSEKSAEQLYTDGMADLSQKNYDKAIESFELIEQQYPYSEWASRGVMMTAYAHYKNERYENAVPVLERFARLYPAHEQIAYVYYLRALCYYEQIMDIERDQGNTQAALDTLQEVVSRFPDSEYGRDARLKLDLVRDHLAGKEVEIGRYYLARGQYIAAINRFKSVVEDYQTTSHTAEALHRLVESYLLLGVRDEAKRNAAVLGFNYPDSKWYRYSFNLLEGDVDIAAKPKDGETQEPLRAAPPKAGSKPWYSKLNPF